MMSARSDLSIHVKNCLRPSVPMQIVLGLLAAILATTIGTAQELQVPFLDRSLALEATDAASGDRMVYRLFLPPADPPLQQPQPLILYLHGSGDWGDDNVQQMKDAIALVEKTQTAQFGSYLLAPQTPLGRGWSEQRDLTFQILDDVVANYPVDMDRIYIVGFSMGGIGTYDFLQSRPDEFAAAVPIAAPAIYQEPSFADVPIWMWHSVSDRNVPVGNADMMYNNLIQQGSTPLYSHIGGEHQIDQLVEEKDELYEWLMLHTSDRRTRTNFVPSDAVWSYLDDGSDPGTAWREPAFDDSNWPTGPAHLGFGEGDEATTISCGPSSPACNADNLATVYFRNEFEVTDINSVEWLTAQLTRDDSAVVYLNGIEVFRDDDLPDEVHFDTFAERSRDNSPAGMLLDRSLLVAGTNTVAVEIHQRGALSNDLSFDLRITAGRSIPEPGGWSPFFTLLGLVSPCRRRVQSICASVR